MMRRVLVGLVCLAFLTAGVQFVQAQTATTGQIAGDVVDPTGAVVAGAKITIANDTGIKREIASDATGRYQFPLLPPGVYTLEVAAPGFGAVKLANVVVRITETTIVPVPLKMAAKQEAVTVEATPPLVQTESAGHGKVIEQGEIRQLPLSTRNFQQLLALTPGASGSLQNSAELGRGDAVVYVNGQRAMSNAVIINGTDANSIGTGSTPNLAVPATDSMREFIVQTSLYDASQGRSSGGVIAAVTKSGTNSYHGNAYEFMRRTGLNANNFFLNRQGVAKPKLDRDQFGGTFGGPIKKDRAWFFVSYQGTRETNGTSLLNSLSTVFVPQALTNDRSDAGIANLYNTYFGSLYGPYYYAAAKGSPQIKMLQAKFADGSYMIPSAPANATCAKAPCTVATSIPGLSKFREDQFNSNIDLKVTENNRLGVKFFFANNPTTQALYSSFGSMNPLQAPGWPTEFDVNQRLLAIDDTHIFSPTVINNVRFGFSQIAGPSKPGEPFKGADFGISSPLSNLYPGMPTVSLSNMFDLGTSPLSDNFSQVRTTSGADMLTLTRGKHTLKMGAEFKYHQAKLEFNAYTRGQMYFLGVLGNPFADFLFGMPGLTLIGSGDPRRDNRARDAALFLQDDFKLHPRLTLNLGVRWDYYGPFVDTKGRMVAFDPAVATTNPITGLGVAVTGGFVQSGQGNLQGVPKVEDGLVPGDFNNIAPRVGFAWQPTKSNNLVVRGGYGIYYDRPNARLYNSQVFNTPYYSVAMSLAGATYYPQMGNPFVQVPQPSTYPLNMATSAPAYMNTPLMVKGAGGVFTPMTLLSPVSAAMIAPDLHNFRVPYVQQYNFGVQYSFRNSWLVDLGYVGSTGRKQMRLISLNQAPSPGAVYSGPYSIGLAALALPTLGTYAVQSSSNSNYNSLQASLTKRMGHGLQFLASYTFSKSIDDYSGTDVSDLSIIPGNQVKFNNRALSDFDRRHRFVFTGTYDLPKFAKSKGFASKIVNDWELNAIFTGQSGVPFSILGDASAFSQTRADLKNGAWNPTFCGSGEITDARLNSYFDTTAFVKPTAFGDFGTTSRNICRGPAQANVDMSIVKFIPLTEQLKFEFRTEFFNLLNNVNFANPVNIASSGNFGQIVRTSTGPRVIQFAFKFTF